MYMYIYYDMLNIKIIYNKIQKNFIFMYKN